MIYKRITNREAVDLFLRGDKRLRVSTTGCRPYEVPPEALAKVFAEGSKFDFYIEQEPKRAAGSFIVEGQSLTGQLSLSPIAIDYLLRDFPLGTRVKVTVEEMF